MQSLPPDSFEDAGLRNVENESLLQRIGPQDRAIFHLRYFEGYTAREIAEMLNLPAGTVRSRAVPLPQISEK